MTADRHKKMAVTSCGRLSMSWRSIVGTKWRGIGSKPFSNAVRKAAPACHGGRVFAEPAERTTGIATAAAATVSWYSTRAHRGMHREKPHDLYAVLGVSPSATQQQVKDAFYTLSLKYHPDVNKDNPDAHQKFTALTEAYSILGQYEQRKKYDKGLLHEYPGRPHTTHQ